MEGSRLSFIIRATYDVLPTPKNLNQWIGEDPEDPQLMKHMNAKVSSTPTSQLRQNNEAGGPSCSLLKLDAEDLWQHQQPGF